MKKNDDICEDLKMLLENELENDNYNFSRVPFVLFGAGNLGVRTLEGLKKIGIKPVAFGDNDEKKFNTNINGIRILSKEKIMDQYGENILIVLSLWGGIIGKENRVSNVIRDLEEYGFKQVVDITKLYNNYSNIFLPYYCLDLPEKVKKDKGKILECYKLFHDTNSRKQYYEQIKWRLLHDNWEEFVNVDRDQYFPEDMYELKEDDIFYDCGAFDGDTIREILNKKICFKNIISFEPDKNNYNKLTKFVEEQDLYFKSKIETFEYAVGDKEEILMIEAVGNESSKISDNGSCEVKSITIDKFIKDNPENIPSIIKMDIEGFEVKALIGSKITIKKHSPILEICVYHEQNDLWEIPLLIKEINDKYRFYLRHHKGDCWDTVLYAVPEDRDINNEEK